MLTCIVIYMYNVGVHMHVYCVEAIRQPWVSLLRYHTRCFFKLADQAALAGH